MPTGMVWHLCSTGNSFHFSTDLLNLSYFLSSRGNTKFRALCFSRKPEFEAGNHAVKRRIAAEIVNVTKALPGRFLKRRNDKGPWYEISSEKAILKACQVMRDFQRPDRLALREMASANGARKRQRTSESTPGVNLVGPQNCHEGKHVQEAVMGTAPVCYNMWS